MQNEIHLLNFDMVVIFQKFTTPILLLTFLLILGCSSATGPSAPTYRFGDINNNGIAYEIADMVLLTNYFIYGLGVFTIDQEIQIAATDANRDGLTLSVADLTYMLRKVLGEDHASLDPDPVEADYIVYSNGTITVDIELGAAALQLEGNIEPSLRAYGMEMEYAFDAANNVTRVLVYSTQKGETFSGSFLNTRGSKLVSIELATYEGASVNANEVELPPDFYLFGIVTDRYGGEAYIKFGISNDSEVRFEFTNDTGLVVFDFNKFYQAGSHRFTWDATNNYRLAVPDGKYYCSMLFEGHKRTIELLLARASDDMEHMIEPFNPSRFTGDVNLNGVAYEVADVVLFTNYFIYGIGVFTVNLQGQIAATDVNADGLTLSVADLTYMIRTVIGDAQRILTLNPVDAFYNINVKGTIEVDIEIGAAALQLQGNVEPTLLADNMDMEYAFDAVNNVTRVLIYNNTEKGQSFTGEFININGSEVVSIEMATYEGQPVILEKFVPPFFNLYQNNPNPFADSTVIRFYLGRAAEVRFEITNDSKEVVFDFSQYYQAGSSTFTWDGTTKFGLAAPDGIYFCTMTADGQEKTIEMMKTR